MRPNALPVSDDTLLDAYSRTVIQAVERVSPAAQGGLLEGDIIVGYAEAPVAGIDDLHRLLTETRVDVQAPLTVLRRVERITLQVVPRGSKPA